MTVKAVTLTNSLSAKMPCELTRNNHFYVNKTSYVNEGKIIQT